MLTAGRSVVSTRDQPRAPVASACQKSKVLIRGKSTASEMGFLSLTAAVVISCSGGLEVLGQTTGFSTARQSKARQAQAWVELSASMRCPNAHGNDAAKLFQFVAEALMYSHFRAPALVQDQATYCLSDSRAHSLELAALR